jgi:gamma-glutamyl hercynylcysteine S-oxide synthase
MLEDALAEVRSRSLGLLEPLPDEVLRRQHSPLMSPLVWDLAHVANYEDLWLVRALTGEAPTRPELDDLYDAFRHPRRTRESLPILGPAEARSYAATVRERALEVLGALGTVPVDVPVAGTPQVHQLVAGGFVHSMVVQHEHQHDETMLAALQLLPAPGYRPLTAPSRAAAPMHPPAEVLLPGGTFTMGTSTDPWALDNERPAHPVDLAPFWLDTTPVTNAAYAGFVADGGYDRAELWHRDGWAWRLEAGLEHPQFWSPDGAGGWVRDRFGWVEELPPEQPVQHVCWYEADAFARWAGRRLPTEAEWEFAASCAGERRWPWGDDAPTDATASLWSPASPFGPAPVTAHPAGANRWGVLELIGGVWEWTASDFRGHPGFTSWPYREYSEVFFGTDHKVLRGGSWATHPSCIRATFRNWDYPIRRQIFAGFRCARDA